METEGAAEPVQSISECVEVELHSKAPDAVEAVRTTVRGLKGGYLLEQDGRFYVPAGYVAWACQKQGYVKGLVETSDPSPPQPSGLPEQVPGEKPKDDPAQEDPGRPPG